MHATPACTAVSHNHTWLAHAHLQPHVIPHTVTFLRCHADLSHLTCHTPSQDDEERDVLREIISNSKLSEHFLALARDLDVMEPKVPEDVYKTHLTGGNFTVKCEHSTLIL